MATPIHEESGLCLPNLQPLWDSKAPRTLVEFCPSDDPFRGWKVWQDHLRKRRKPKLPAAFTKKKSPVMWGWPETLDRSSLLLNIGSPTALAEIVIGDDALASPDLPMSLQVVALGYAMPRLARQLPAETWWQLLERLHDVAAPALAHRVAWPADPQNVLRQQLLAGELPLALAYLFPEVRALRALRGAARRMLTESLVEVTDGQGLPDVRLFPLLGPLFACWTRCRWIGDKLNRGPWSRDADLQFQWLVRHAIRLADKGGRFLLTPPSATDAWENDLFETALSLGGDNSDFTAAKIALPKSALPKHAKLSKSKTSRAPDPSLNSDWAGITIMANGWSQKDVRLALAFANDPLTFELSIAGRPLLSGAWICETECDGITAHPIGEWEQLCWESGKRFDLLELGIELTQGLRLERQIVFGRLDEVLYVADMIFSRDNDSRTIRHSFGLPLAQDTGWRPELETRDGTLIRDRARAVVLPLGLAEWRSDPRGGTLEQRAGRLTLMQETNGAAVCCPLFFDFHRDRAAEERTWRQLTVGEELEIVPRDRAVGYRAQTGDSQWIFYRSLSPAANRSVLGQNIAGEFSAGRFFHTGKYQEWIEIEAV